MINELIQTWEINNRVNLYLLNDIDEAWLQDTAASKGRNVGSQFSHIHNVRLMWLKEAAPELLKGAYIIDKEKSVTRKIIATALNNSNDLMIKMLEKCLHEGKVKGFKPHAVAFHGYIIAHEAHHRGQIMICLKENGHLKSKSLSFALWQWGTR